MAQDKGYPPLQRTVEVQIDVVDRANNPPVWDQVVYGPIYVKENMPVGGKVASIKARSVIIMTIKKNKLFINAFFCFVCFLSHFVDINNSSMIFNFFCISCDWLSFYFCFYHHIYVKCFSL